MRRDVLDPSPALAAARESASVQCVITAYGVPAVLVTRYENVKNALADHERLSNRKPRGWAGPEAPALTDEEYEKLTAGGLLGMDPPDHQRLRRLLTPEFTVRRMKNLQPRIVEIVDQHLDAMAEAGAPADLGRTSRCPYRRW
jgi:cytochrome P450